MKDIAFAGNEIQFFPTRLSGQELRTGTPLFPCGRGQETTRMGEQTKKFEPERLFRNVRFDDAAGDDFDEPSDPVARGQFSRMDTGIEPLFAEKHGGFARHSAVYFTLLQIPRAFPDS